MKKRKKISQYESFTEANLPHTRPQVFLSVYKTRALFIFEISLLLALFCLPLFIWSIIIRLYIDNIPNGLLEDMSNKADILKDVFMWTMIKNGVNILLFGVAGIGFGGAIHVLQKLVWNQLAMLSDFFEGMKKNIAKYIFWGILLGISFFIFEFVVSGMPLTNLNTFVRMLLYGLAFLQLVLFAIFISYLFLQNEYYYLDPFHIVTNAFKFTIKSFIPMVGFILGIMLPYFLIFIHSFVINIVATFLFLFLVSFGLIPLILHANYQFDKNINKDQYPEIYDRGVYRQGKIELPK